MQKLAQQLHVTVAQRAPPEFLKPLQPVLEVEPGQTARYAQFGLFMRMNIYFEWCTFFIVPVLLFRLVGSISYIVDL